MCTYLSLFHIVGKIGTTHRRFLLLLRILNDTIYRPCTSLNDLQGGLFVPTHMYVHYFRRLSIQQIMGRAHLPPPPVSSYPIGVDVDLPSGSCRRRQLMNIKKRRMLLGQRRDRRPKIILHVAHHLHTAAVSNFSWLRYDANIDPYHTKLAGIVSASPKHVERLAFSRRGHPSLILKSMQAMMRTRTDLPTNIPHFDTVCR